MDGTETDLDQTARLTLDVLSAELGGACLGFIEEARDQSRRMGQPPRWIALKRDLGPDWEEFTKACADPSISFAAIYRVLRKRNIHVSDTTIKNYCRDTREGNPPWDRS